METRFGLKDFILYGLIVLLGVVFLLGRVQYDRQYALLESLKDQSLEQSRDLAAMRRDVDRGPRAGPPTPATQPSASTDDPFTRIRAAAALPDYSAGDWLVDSGPNTSKLTPLVSFDVFAAEIHSHVLQTLVERDPVTLEYKPLLAVPGWTIEDHLKDYHAFVDPKLAGGAKLDDVLKDPACPCPIRMTFHLRPNVTFSDGQPLTADDVVWTFNWIKNPAVAAARQRSGLEKIRRAVKSGADGVTFEFASPYFDAIGMAGGIEVMPRHFYEKYTPEQFNSSTGLLLGSGPYKMNDPTAWRPGQQIELIRNDRYWGEPRHLTSWCTASSFRIFRGSPPSRTASSIALAPHRSSSKACWTMPTYRSEQRITSMTPPLPAILTSPGTRGETVYPRDLPISASDRR